MRVSFRNIPGFSYTTPSVFGKHSAAERRAHGCEEKNKKFTGKLCLDKDCRKKAYDSFCKTSHDPCNEPKASCPVQLIFIKGQPHLRFCRQLKKPGYVVKVEGPMDAQRVAEKYCRGWKAPKSYFVDVEEEGQVKRKKKLKPWPSRFFNTNAPELIKQAKHEFPPTGLAKLPKQ